MQTSYLEAVNLDSDALMAKADWYMCVAEQAALAAANGGDDEWFCYEEYDWIYDPSIGEEIFTLLEHCIHYAT